MLQRLLAAPLFLLAAFAASASVSAAPPSAPGSDAPAPFTIEGGPRSLGGGVQQTWRVKVDEDRAVQAIFKGGMWLPNGTGGREYARYASHILHPDGSWTWIGKVATAHGEQSVVITFGKDAVFGRIPQSNDYPLRLETEHGVISLVRTSGAALSRSATAISMQAKTDTRTLPRRRSGVMTGSSVPAVAGAQVLPTGAASTNAIVTIDVMVAYTPGIVQEYGSKSAALTRINNLVAIANQAYSDSKVNQRIRLVDTGEVNYPDNTSNDSALDDITGYDSNGNQVPIPPSLANIRAIRAKYGADLVSLLRKYDNATNGGCGLAWIIGGNETPIVPTEDNAYGYSVVGDGGDAGYYCLDTSFAHELGHNMGDAHDRANADNPGAYPYSYGYKSSSSTGFATIMAYGSPNQTPLAVFSNPNISICQGQPCGVADSSSSSADNAHSMNNTAALIAQFEPVESVAPNDVDGDGKSDLLWSLPSASQFAYWIMNGISVTRAQAFNAMSGYHVAATGDFNTDGILDLMWTNGSAVYEWVGNGTGYTSQLVGYYDSRWQPVGAADIDGDGKPDLLWHSPQLSSFAFWIMDGVKVVRQASYPIANIYRFAGSGDFNGDGKADIVWTDGYSVYAWLGNGSQFTSKLVGAYGTGWKLVGVGDIDGDGQSDLLFSNRGASSFAYWLLKNAYPVKSASFPVGSQYWVGAIGDFDGNGFTDVMWTDGAALYEWRGNGSGFVSNYIANYGAGWSLVQTGETP